MTSAEQLASGLQEGELVQGLVGAVPGPAALVCAHTLRFVTVNDEFRSRILPETPVPTLPDLLNLLPPVNAGDAGGAAASLALTKAGDLVPVPRRLPDGHPVQIYSRRVTPDYHLVRVEIMPVAGDTYRPIEGLAVAPVTAVALVEALYSAPVALLILDPNDRIAAWNQGFLQINENAPLEIGITFTELLHRYHALEQDWDLAAPVDAEIPWVQERLDRHWHYAGPFEEFMGNGRWFLTSEHRAADGSTLIMHVDITRQKQSAEEVALAREQAEAANRAKSDFLALMSHDLRTPLNSILGFSEVIRDDALKEGLSPLYQEYAGNIHDSGQHLLELVNTILDLAKIEAGRFELNEETSVLAQDVEAALRLLRDRFETKRLTLDFDNRIGTARMLYDRRCLRQILMNLLSNAEKFTPPGGRVVVMLDVAEGDTVLSVDDTGQGIPPNELDRVLEPFSQGRRQGAAAGTGLGLPLVKSLAERHGGSFELNSAPGRGTRAAVRFPGWRRQAAGE